MAENACAGEHAISFMVSAPGKVILHGEHSVVYGKLALAASLSLRTRLEFKETSTPGDLINLLLPDIDVSYTLSASELNRILTKPSVILKEPVNFTDYNWNHPEHIDSERFVTWLKDSIIKDQNWNASQQTALVAFHFLLIGMLSGLNVSVQPFKLTVKSDLSIGSGLGSSASYSVCLAAGIYQYIKRRVAQSNMLTQDISRTGFQPCQISSVDLLSLECSERDLIEQWARVGDGIMHGTASGVDTTTIATGGIVEFRRTPEGQPHVNPVPLAAKLKIVLVDTGITRNTKRMVEHVKDLKIRLPGVVDPLLEAMDGIAVAARKILTETDCFNQLKELMDLNQHVLRTLGVSHPALEEICDVAKKHCLSGKLTGAGGGGYAFILLPPTITAEGEAALLDELEARGYQSVVTSLGGPGVEVG